MTTAELMKPDRFHHGTHWTPRPPAEFAADVATALTENAWIIDGNDVDHVGDRVGPQADTVVGLDLVLWGHPSAHDAAHPAAYGGLDLLLSVTLPCIVRRTLQRVRRRTALWAGDREHWSGAVGRKFLIRWAVHQRRHLRAALPVRAVRARSVRRRRGPADLDAAVVR